jgi:hypothetical protein
LTHLFSLSLLVRHPPPSCLASLSHLSRRPCPSAT